MLWLLFSKTVQKSNYIQYIFSWRHALNKKKKKTFSIALSKKTYDVIIWDKCYGYCFLRQFERVTIYHIYFDGDIHKIKKKDSFYSSQIRRHMM